MRRNTKNIAKIKMHLLKIRETLNPERVTQLHRAESELIRAISSRDPAEVYKCVEQIAAILAITTVNDR